MKHSIRISAVAALVTASAFALPAAANAEIYPPSNACSVSPANVTPGGTVQFSCADGTFSGNEAVTITVDGPTSVDVGFIKFAVTSSGNATSTADGGLGAVPITFPGNASGVYNIAAVSASSAGGTSSVSVGTTTGGSTLPATGIDSGSLLGLWVGGGALVLAGGAIAVAAAVRRNRKADATV